MKMKKGHASFTRDEAEEMRRVKEQKMDRIRALRKLLFIIAFQRSFGNGGIGSIEIEKGYIFFFLGKLSRKKRKKH